MFIGEGQPGGFGEYRIFTKGKEGLGRFFRHGSRMVSFEAISRLKNNFAENVEKVFC